jgi:enoyl-CoA hydratase/carnithine racemase
MAESSASPVIITRPANHVALVTIDRPEARNAINGPVTQGLERAIAVTESDPEIWVVVLTGSGGKVFSAGADLKEVSRGNLDSLSTPDGGFAGFVQAKRTKLWIAAVDGLALAGGCEHALACELIVASEHGGFGLPEVKRGLVAAAGGVYRLPRAIPRAIAIEMIVTGARMSAERAMEWGLVNCLVPAGTVVERALELAGSICENAPLAVRESLAIAKLAVDLDDSGLQGLSNDAQRRLSTTEDFAEGPLAFIEKRAPRWRGR